MGRRTASASASLARGPLLRGITLVASMVVVLGAGPGSDASAKKVWNFESDAPGAIARGFHGEVGRWEVVRDGDNRVLAQQAENESPVYNVTLVEGTTAKDLDLSVRVRAVKGEIDQGGGLVWRAKDAKNYYIARFNPLEENYRVYKVQDGKRTQLKSAKAPADQSWHTLRIAMNGSKITCYLDGKKTLEAEDSTFPDAGRIGLWSKADAQTYFDDLMFASE
jgi:hypothetical protein